MILKLLALSAIIYLIYIVMFKNKSKHKTNDKNENEQIDTMQECSKCKTFVSRDEAIISNGQYYCSDKCI